jgi:hypothetical protein
VARRAHWRIGRILAVVLSGFVPFLAFIVEHRVYQQMQVEWADDPEAITVPDRLESGAEPGPTD